MVESNLMEDSTAANGISQDSKLQFLGLLLWGCKSLSKMIESIFNFILCLIIKLRKVCSGSSSNGPSFVPQLTQLDEMVYEVYTPLPKQKPDLEIIFVHGLQLTQQKEAYMTTWMSYDNSQLWLKTWLVEEFPKARILTISYDCSAKRSDVAGILDMYRTTENLVHELTRDSVRVGREGCPVVFVGHCVGGLVVKDLCVRAGNLLTRESPESPEFQRVDDLFSNLRGMFFYGTPHLGSLLGDEFHQNPGALAAQIKVLKASNSRRNEEFLKLKNRYKWASYGIGEGQKTFVGGLDKCIRVVEEASSRAYMDSYYTARTSDHFNICKPRGKKDSAFQKLTDFLHQVQGSGALDGSLADIRASYQPRDIIDLEGRAGQVRTMLAKPNADKIFIVGLSGIGKTTLAEQVFRDMCPNFKVTCFVSLESSEPQYDCQEQVLKRIQEGLHSGRGGLNGSPSRVLGYLKRKKVLMVVDNVQSQKQLDALCTKTWLDGSASRLIVTSTNPRLGTQSNTFQVLYLNDTESRQLFLKYAFEGREGPPNVTMFVDQVIRKCENFPLSLKILGSYVGHEEDKDKPELWKELIQKMDKAVELVHGDPDLKLWARLRPCYDSLDPSEQQLFLDIATTFCGYSFSMVECIWNGCQEFPLTAWTNVKKRFLASVDKDGKLWMHTQLRDLGRSIACPRNTTLEKWQRVSETASAKELIANCQGVVDTRTLKLENGGQEKLFLRNTTFSKFTYLQSLILTGVEMMIIGETTLQLPPSVVYLSWRYGLFEVCPVDFSKLESLSVLDLSYCRAMKSLPSSLRNARKLTWLELKGCRSLKDLGVLKLCHLKHLGLSGTGLTHVPRNLDQFSDPKYLLAHDTKLTKVPQRVCGLAMLVSLDLSCTKVGTLPEAIGNLKSLKELNLKRTLLRSLPESVGELQGLKVLNLRGTPLENLPESVCKLRFLKRLTLTGTEISALPDGIGDLVELEVFELIGSRLSRLPETVGRLLRLEEFTVTLDLNDNCLEHLASFKSLKKLYLDVGILGEEHALALGEEQSQTRIHSLLSPVFSLHELAHVSLCGRNCPESLLPALFGALHQISSLSMLVLCQFHSVEVMPYELGTLTGLTRLAIWDCERLRELPESLGSLCGLTNLYLLDLPSMSRLPESLNALSCLSQLLIYNCESLENMPGSFGHLSPLEQECFSLQSNNSETVNSIERTMPSELDCSTLRTDSWKLLECFLECCQKRISRPKVIFNVSCEKMEKVMKEATQDRDGVGYVVDISVASELFTERNSNQRGHDCRVQFPAGRSACHGPWNRCTGLQSVVIRCYGNDRKTVPSEGCGVHTKLVRLIDERHSGEDSEDEGDSEIEEDNMDSGMGGDESDSEMSEAASSEVEEHGAGCAAMEDQSDTKLTTRLLSE